MEAFLTGFKQKPQDSKGRIKSQKHIPWVEKYRPKTIDEVAYQTEVVSVLQRCIEGSDLPNLLFYGPPGTGKTSLIFALARQLFGPLYSERVLELNASDERGISVIREKVKAFAHIAVSSSTNSSGSSSTNIPPYKLIILDEADSMTAPAQAALRRTMETEMRTTRFCLTCNYVTRIIEPITSRCAKFRFRPLDNEIARARLRHIADAENLSITNETLDHLLSLCHGDLRQGITMLQCVHQLIISVDDSDVGCRSSITSKELDEAAAVVPSDIIKNLIKTSENGSFDDLQIIIKNLLLEGYSAHQTTYQLHEHIINDEKLSCIQKASILESLAVADSRLIDGADEYLQLLAVGGTLLKTIQSN
ncbi:unnamed protein product [Schistosoma mattheei]|uniref:AAA+ ATPase domain-containing protein n=1 Tax=Schistosoma mattheei TaxID=31246 RepID=A0AA85B0K4_9TREM|nr:unnamed protein product [Schistosoma mattheei]